MKNKPAFFLIVFLTFSVGLFASGKTEEEVKVYNDNWILCVTDFNISSIPEEKKVVAGVITRKIVERLSVISYRIRVSPEYAYYEEQVWARERAVTAKALSAKQNERSQFVYKGDTNWKYRQNLAKIDAEIEKLWLTLEEIESNAPKINSEPEFKLTDGNLNNSFPAAPRAGLEYKFCTDQKADAFLSGSITDYYGRYYVVIKLYAVYTGSFVYEDNIIFSPDDLESSLDEITERLILALSGNRPSAIVVKAQPDDALVLINRSFAGRGDTGIIERPPGKVVITASAPDYESQTIETDIAPGELVEVDINLSHTGYGDVEITDSVLSGKVYNGALYVGEAPLTLRLPLSIMEYVELETSDNKRGKAVFYTPEDFDTTYILSINPGTPLAKGSVDKARRYHYWGWGATWITGIAAWIVTRTYMDANSANAYSGKANQQFIERNQQLYYVSMGTLIAVGAVAVYEIFQVSRYIYTANKDATPVVRTAVKTNAKTAEETSVPTGEETSEN